ncbi:MAG: phosphoribosylformylglycinamidine synthase subunit PurQ, partial [Planctomycetota bacterium]
LAARLQLHLRDFLTEFTQRSDRLVLGICNGMQVMMRLGVLTPQAVAAGVQDSVSGAEANLRADSDAATLTWNNHGRFEDRWVNLAVDPASPCVFLRGVESMYLPIAHAEGKFMAADEQQLAEMRSAGQLALRYCDGQPGEDLDSPLAFPSNPNGAQANVAGVCDPSGRVFGLMPHPERHVDVTHHPAWTRKTAIDQTPDGLAIFQNAIRYFE